LKEPEGVGGAAALVENSPWDVLFSSERLEGLIEAESLLSLAGLEEGGGILILGLSIVVFVCSVPAYTPFLRVDDALVADRSVCEFDLFATRGITVVLADPEPELEVKDVTLAKPFSPSSSSSICSGPCRSAFSRKFSAIPIGNQER
jgi:hypothetical protein